MFQDLTKRINIENMTKIKNQHSRSRYPIQDQSPNTRNQIKNESEQSLDDLQVQMVERQQNFRKINLMEEDKEIIKRNDTIPPNMLRKLQNQIELLKQRIQLQKKSHLRQFQYQEELYKRRQQWMKMQISKLKCLVQKYKQEDSQLKSLRSQMKKYAEIKDSLQSKVEKLQFQNRQLKGLMQKLQFDKKREQQKRIKQIIIEGNQIQKINKLTQRIREMELQLGSQQKINEERKRNIKRLTQEIQKLKQRVSEKEHQLDEAVNKRDQIIAKQEQQYSSEIQNLKKRNHNLETTFIQKMSEITKLQAHLLSNNTISSHQIYANVHTRQSRAGQSYNISEESPIRPLPQVINLSQRKQSIQRQNQNNPQNTFKSNNVSKKAINNKKDDENQCECCYRKIQKYKTKLDQANRKIIGLIQQKMQCIRSTSSQRNKIINQQGTFTRTRIMSWNRQVL